MKMNGLVAVIGLVALLTGQVNGHDWAWGKCPFVDTPLQFDPNRFLGTWFVIEQIDTGAQCLRLKYERESDASLKLTKIRQFHALKTVGVDHTNRYSAILDQPSDNEARMRVKWTLNPGKADYVVVDTDYDSYALVFECQQLSRLAHRYSAAILSKTSTLSPSTVSSLKRELEKSDVDTGDFRKIDHSSCQTLDDPQVNIDVNRDTFKDIFTTTRDGIEDFSTTIANGVRSITSTVASAATSVAAAATGTEATTSTTTTTTTTTTTPQPQEPPRDLPEPLDPNPSTSGINPDEVGNTVDESINAIDESINNVDDGANGIDENTNTVGGSNREGRDNPLDENTYNVDGGNVETVDDIIRTVIRVD